MILIINTEKNSYFSVAIAKGKKILKSKTVEKKYKQSEFLLLEIKRLVESCKVWKVKSVLVIKGPGDFSALRIGVSTANALAYAWSIPVIGVKIRKNWQDLEVDLKMQKVLEQGLKQESKKGKWVKPVYRKLELVNVK